MFMQNRRTFLKTVGASGALAAPQLAWLADAAGRRRGTGWQANGGDPWSEVPRILSRIVPPRLPDREFNILKFGACGDGAADCTEAFRRAIAEGHRAGGGKVVVPEGRFSTGAIRLLSGVNLHIKEGATICFSRDPLKYPLALTRWEGTELRNYSSFIYALDQENVAITGAGTIDGQADSAHWWNWKGRREQGEPDGQNQNNDRKLLQDMGEKGVPVEQRVFGPGHYLRPQFVQPYRCRNVLIEGITLKNSPMWQVHPVLCTNVTVRKLNIDSSGPNNDGCDPESCTDVLIEDCVFNTGDDCIAIKSGRNADGRRLHAPSENIVIRGCRMKDGHGGVTLGSEISGGVRNVFVENCRMDSPRLEDALRIKNNAMRGGLLENIYARDVRVGQIAVAGLSIDFHYEEGDEGPFTPVVRNVQVERMTVEQTKYPLYLRGFKNAPIEDVRLSSCEFTRATEKSVLDNVKGLQLEGVRINGEHAKTPEQS